MGAPDACKVLGALRLAMGILKSKTTTELAEGPLRGVRTWALLVCLLVIAAAGPLCGRSAAQETMPLAQVHEGMQGYAYTVFAGEQVEKFDLVVLGVMPNFLGPKQSIILVELKGPKVEHTGVVAGMSGSPVYLEGKLVGALSLKLGIFTKEPIAGVTPIDDILRPADSGNATSQTAAAFAMPNGGGVTAQSQAAQVAMGAQPVAALPNALANGAALQPIETPLVFSGISPAALQPFLGQLQSYGFVAAQGGTQADAKDAKKDERKLAAGDMAGMVLVQGDATISSACTVTAVHGDDVYLCGHPFLNFGNVQLPMARSTVVTTLSSDLASTKIVNFGGTIGTITGDHLTAVTGKLGAGPALIPVDITFESDKGEKKLHFEVVNHPKLTPLLVALTTFNGVSQNSLYGEGQTLRMVGEITLKGHAPVRLENTIAPTDNFGQDSLPIALTVQSTFSKLFSNIFEVPDVERVSVRVESKPGRDSFSIESAWLEKGEAAPGENLKVRVLLRPYRGPERIEETIVHVPDQIARGTMLRVLVSDADWMNRAARGFVFSGAGGTGGLDQIITLINQERHNDRAYVGLFAPAPTMLWDDKELPNVPLSQINMIDGRPGPGSVQVLRESLASESSMSLGGPVSGLISLNLQIR